MASHEKFPDRQRAEIDALRAMYPEEGAVNMDAAYMPDQANEDNVSNRDTFVMQTVSGTAFIPGHYANHRRVGIRFRLPSAYPQQPPEIQVLCEADRAIHNRLTDAVAVCIDQNSGTEVLLLILQALQELLKDCPEAGEDKQVEAVGGQPAVQIQQPLVRMSLWFHHIKDITKRKNIVGWASELNIRGFSKPGFPGVIICEGRMADVKDYYSRIKALRWQAISVRAEEEDAEGEESENNWHFKSKLRELEEGGMDVLSAECRAVGLNHLFKAALKLA